VTNSAGRRRPVRRREQGGATHGGGRPAAPGPGRRSVGGWACAHPTGPDRQCPPGRRLFERLLGRARVAADADHRGHEEDPALRHPRLRPLLWGPRRGRSAASGPSAFVTRQASACSSACSARGIRRFSTCAVAQRRCGSVRAAAGRTPNDAIVAEAASQPTLSWRTLECLAQIDDNPCDCRAGSSAAARCNRYRARPCGGVQVSAAWPRLAVTVEA